MDWVTQLSSWPAWGSAMLAGSTVIHSGCYWRKCSQCTAKFSEEQGNKEAGLWMVLSSFLICFDQAHVPSVQPSNPTTWYVNRSILLLTWSLYATDNQLVRMQKHTKNPCAVPVTLHNKGHKTFLEKISSFQLQWKGSTSTQSGWPRDQMFGLCKLICKVERQKKAKWN